MILKACASTGILLLLFGAAVNPKVPALTCSTFAEMRSVAAVQTAIGSAETAAHSLPLGASEGDMVPATVFDPATPNRRIEIVWRDGQPSRGPHYVRLRGHASDWRTAEGVSIGTSLRELERLNGRPFRLTGFAFDAAATVTGWDNGRLHALSDGACHVWVHLDSLPPLSARQRALYNQVLGDRIFSSAHPAMRALNPRISELLLEFQ